MSVKAQLTGTVVSDKMDKTVVVAVERQVRHGVYGKSQKKTSKFVAHNENNEAKAGDVVAIAGSAGFTVSAVARDDGVIRVQLGLFIGADRVALFQHT